LISKEISLDSEDGKQEYRQMVRIRGNGGHEIGWNAFRKSNEVN
jgi:hypothetical protein